MSIKLKFVFILCLALLFIATGISLALERAHEINGEGGTVSNKESLSANTRSNVSTKTAVTVKQQEPEELFIDP